MARGLALPGWRSGGRAGEWPAVESVYRTAVAATASKATVLPVCRVGDRRPAGMLTGKPRDTRAAGAVRGCRGPTQDPAPLRVDLEGCSIQARGPRGALGKPDCTRSPGRRKRPVDGLGH